MTLCDLMAWATPPTSCDWPSQMDSGVAVGCQADLMAVAEVALSWVEKLMSSDWLGVRAMPSDFVIGLATRDQAGMVGLRTP